MPAKSTSRATRPLTLTGVVSPLVVVTVMDRDRMADYMRLKAEGKWQPALQVLRDEILDRVWGYNVYPTTRTIDNFILSFRKYFEEDSRNPKYFHSVRGVGYKYAE